LLCFTQNDHTGQAGFKICPFLKWAHISYCFTLLYIGTCQNVNSAYTLLYIGAMNSFTLLFCENTKYIPKKETFSA
jgi:hypothetical protein